MEKLVRDRIPEILSAKGEIPDCYLAAPEALDGLLRQKLVEEALEVQASQDGELLEELGDVQEVLYALLEASGYTKEQLEQARLTKRAQRGGFTRRIVWRG